LQQHGSSAATFFSQGGLQGIHHIPRGRVDCLGALQEYLRCLQVKTLCHVSAQNGCYWLLSIHSLGDEVFPTISLEQLCIPIAKAVASKAFVVREFVCCHRLFWMTFGAKDVA
jgi:hypothetical protein